jgi:hypothetical protein
VTHPDGRPYTVAEKKALIAEAKATARELLRKLELLASLDGRDEVVGDGGQGRG